MTASLLVVTRFTELNDAGQLDSALKYLDDNVIYNSWIGIVEGRENVSVCLRDHVRFSHHRRIFSRWKQVQHCLDPAVARKPGERVFDSEGYDSAGYATFERDGTIASHAKLHLYNVAVKETFVVKGERIILINISKRL